MRNFIYHAPTRILFGKNKVNELGAEVIKHGSKVLLAYGSHSIKESGLYEKVVKILANSNIPFVELSGILPNPKIASVRQGIDLCRKHNVDFILAVGGGSVIDCVKAIAAGVSYNGDVWDFMIRKAKVVNPLPFGTILTLAATGSEMNGNAVISNPELFDKRAMGDASLQPCFSILDPTLTFTVNRWQTAAGAADIMSHIFEQYFTPDEGAFVQDAIAESILKTAIKFGPIAVSQPDNYEARANLMWASSLALNGLTVTGKAGGDWATHDMEHQLSAVNDMTHGAGLAILFPHWMNYVLNEITAAKFAQVARNVWNVVENDDVIAAKEGIKQTRLFFNSLDLPNSLSSQGFGEEHLLDMAKKACLFGPIGALKKLNAEDVAIILRNAL